MLHSLERILESIFCSFIPSKQKEKKVKPSNEDQKAEYHQERVELVVLAWCPHKRGQSEVDAVSLPMHLRVHWHRQCGSL